jgi:hypothetical protein
MGHDCAGLAACLAQKRLPALSLFVRGRYRIHLLLDRGEGTTGEKRRVQHREDAHQQTGGKAGAGGGHLLLLRTRVDQYEQSGRQGKPFHPILTRAQEGEQRVERLDVGKASWHVAHPWNDQEHETHPRPSTQVPHSSRCFRPKTAG